MFDKTGTITQGKPVVTHVLSETTNAAELLTVVASLERGDALVADGKTPLYFERNNVLIGVIAVADVVKPTSKQAIQEMKEMGIEVVMLTGDNAKTAEEIRRLQDEGKKVA